MMCSIFISKIYYYVSVVTGNVLCFVFSVLKARLANIYLCQGGYVFIGISLFVSGITHKLLDRFFQKFCGKAAHGPTTEETVGF